MDLAELKGLHRGRLAAVLGGGPSLPSDLRRVPPGALLIGVNQHSLILPLDYIVFQDPEVAGILGDHPAKRVTQHRAHADIWSGIAPDFQFSGGTAVWVAEYLGCSPILICGVDEYSGRRRYWHSKDECEPMGADGRAWERVRNYLKQPETVRAVSGPLTNLFGVYENGQS